MAKDWELLRAEMRTMAQGAAGDKDVMAHFVEKVAGLLQEDKEIVAREVMVWVDIIGQSRNRVASILRSSLAVVAAYVPMEIHNSPTVVSKPSQLQKCITGGGKASDEEAMGEWKRGLSGDGV